MTGFGFYCISFMAGKKISDMERRRDGMGKEGMQGGETLESLGLSFNMANLI